MSLDASLQDQLDRDEQLVWVGKANSDRLLRRSDYFFVWAGIFLGTVAMAAFIAAILELFNGNGTGALVGFLLSLVLGAVGLYFVFGRFARRFGSTRRAAYGITDTRVIVIELPTELGAAPEISQVAISPDLESRLVTHYENRGTISVGDLTFENIDDAPVVFELLQAQIAQSARAQG